MTKTMTRDRMLKRTDRAEDELLLTGDTVGKHGAGEPCVTAATDSMAEAATWVYLTFEDAVAEIIDNKDGVSVDEMAERIRAAVERGVEKGRAKREKERRL